MKTNRRTFMQRCLAAVAGAVAAFTPGKAEGNFSKGWLEQQSEAKTRNLCPQSFLGYWREPCPKCKSGLTLITLVNHPYEMELFLCQNCNYRWTVWDNKKHQKPLGDKIIFHTKKPFGSKPDNDFTYDKVTVNVLKRPEKTSVCYCHKPGNHVSCNFPRCLAYNPGNEKPYKDEYE